jgi:hypothetical protein
MGEYSTKTMPATERMQKRAGSFQTDVEKKKEILTTTTTSYLIISRPSAWRFFFSSFSSLLGSHDPILP